ncbi:KUP/HAK/KT family potassium transporter [Bifidobacterium miconisargentati]|uniref:KUP/HAK/KT family potassium transporter n=1 Tax=Bifidobacterium miconisargentati TaxID=2834437 RepID=UPI001BDC694B|nr:KUP/HAK/KT family potassium transporter [Bifidobacterium miconisargentati]MBW3089233.1 KUP/HAK/KT family potassium transporter [Bifidobacterium miconisargentati]
MALWKRKSAKGTKGEGRPIDKVTPAGMLIAVGIVYGDLGTSPIYAPKALMLAQGGRLDRFQILGSLSLVFWFMLLVVTIKYVWTVMNADNDGEGGVFALFAAVRRHWKHAAAFAMVGAAAFLADSVFTPAVSITSAVEGLASIPAIGGSVYWSEELAVMIAIAIIVLLFLSQHAGTNRLGTFFGPVMTIWFLFLAVIGVMNIVTRDWTVFEALDPTVGVRFLFSDENKAGVALMGSVFLALTGAEALYADMGHVGRGNIRASWPLVNLTLICSYFGQGAWMLEGHRVGAGDPAPFFQIIPEQIRPFGVLLALTAGVIASQALISGAFTLTAAADGLGWLPRLNMRYPGVSKGQIYIPSACGVLAGLTVLVVLYFRSSSAMEAAYGLALTIAMLMITVLLFEFLWRVEGKRLGALVSCVLFGLIELLFLSASVFKFMEGGYITVIIWGVLFGVFHICSRGSLLEASDRGHVHADDLSHILAASMADKRRDLVADNLVYLTADPSVKEVEKDVAASMVHHRGHAYWIVTLVQSERPFGRRWKAVSFGPSLHRVIISLGYKEPQFYLRQYMDAIMADMLSRGEIARIEPQWPKLANRNERLGIGSIRYVLMHRVVSPESSLPDSDRTLLRSYQWIKRMISRPVEWFGLETNDPIVDTVPIWSGGDGSMAMERIGASPVGEGGGRQRR